MSTTENSERRFRLINFSDLKFDPSEPIHGEAQWGGWRRRGRALIYGRDDYQIDLTTCTSSAEVLDWIAQVAQKNWATSSCLAGLVRALDDTLDLQSTLCGCGQDKRLTKIQIRRRLGMKT